MSVKHVLTSKREISDSKTYRKKTMSLRHMENQQFIKMC